MGMIALPARPSFTASSASSNEKHGKGRHSGATSSAARWEFAPGAPWNATARTGSVAAAAVIFSTSNLMGLEHSRDWDTEKIIAARQVLGIVEQLIEMAKDK